MILTNQSQVAEADMSSLIATYRHYTGRFSVRFTSRSIAERRVVDAIMSSADLRGHLGVPKDTKPQPTAMTDLITLAEETGRDSPTTLAKEGLPGSQAGVETDPSANPYPPGSLAARLWARAEGLPEAPEPPKPPRQPLSDRRPRNAGANWIRVASGTPTAKLMQGSTRAAVFRFIESCVGAGTTYAVLIEQFGPAARDCVNKLIKTRHVEEFTPTTKESQ